jgi:Flp pilus assembly protein TadD
MDLGVALHAQNRKEDAVREFQRALELRPEYPEAMFNLKAAMDSQ